MKREDDSRAVRQAFVSLAPGGTLAASSSAAEQRSDVRRVWDRRRSQAALISAAMSPAADPILVATPPW
jgi:hypothetical protein